MKEIEKVFLSLFVYLVIAPLAYAQGTYSEQVFMLEKDLGHYYFQANVNGIPTKLMIESGIPALILGENYYEQYAEALGLEVKKSDKKLRFLSKIHNIKYTSEGTLSLGNVSYDGPIFILEGNAQPCIPLQYLMNVSDSSRIVVVDLPNKVLKVKNKAFVDQLPNSYKRYQLRMKEYGNIPVVDSPLSITIDGINKINVNGSFIVDFGNASLLFLMKQNDIVQQIISNNTVKLHEAKDLQGRVVAEGFLADKLTICNKTFSTISVGVTDKLTTIKETGFLGLKYFTGPVILDFTRHVMYVEK